MATLLSEAIKLVITALITLGTSSFLMVSAHESHDHDHGSIGSAQNAVSHEASPVSTLDVTTSVAESIHGHSHDGFSHDHAVELLSEQSIDIENAALTIAPDDLASSVYAPPVFEINIPPRP
ncbi:MAG: hypothetical protein AB8C46_20855 [Burkholderiaceae bacterium]